MPVLHEEYNKIIYDKTPKVVFYRMLKRHFGQETLPDTSTPKLIKTKMRSFEKNISNGKDSL
jgi:hypothetical protein